MPCKMQIPELLNHRLEKTIMTWVTPAFSDIRFGFEVTMYVCNR